MGVRFTDCFAYVNDRMCRALSDTDCENCSFYKPKGTECDSCRHKYKKSCTKCRKKFK